MKTVLIYCVVRYITYHLNYGLIGNYDMMYIFLGLVYCILSNYSLIGNCVIKNILLRIIL
ncbi:hypothetical protein BDF21DRAFT_418570 [Thamnidium elegans]|nr:hypothetical protein BDF21DRAFT_418570 [Thamnidium elegans]